MSLFIQRPEKDSLEKSRGIGSYDLNLRVILVRSSVESVAQAFTSIKRMSIWESNVYGCEVEIRRESVFVLQLKGHSWTLIYVPYFLVEVIDTTKISIQEIERLMHTTLEQQLDLLETDALKLSELLHTCVIFYSESDTVGIVEYCLYRDGVLAEKLSFEEGSLIELHSKYRQIEARDIKDVYKFTDETIREQDAYVPWIDTKGNFDVGTRAFLQIEGLTSDEIVRMDYIARQ